jgi:hypothetical protein
VLRLALRLGRLAAALLRLLRRHRRMLCIWLATSCSAGGRGQLRHAAATAGLMADMLLVHKAIYSAEAG